MVTKLGRYIGIFMMLVVFLTANGLQYTHDTTHPHSHDQPCSAIEGVDDEHPDTDECGLCWFISHQVSSLFVFDALLPEAAIQTCRSPRNERFRLSCQEGVRCSLGNKDPPSAV